MKKSYLIIMAIFALLYSSNTLKAQTYTLTRGLPLAEIAGTGTAITGLGDDNSVGPFNVGFTFTFIGSAFTQFYLGSNGIITFGSGSVASNITIPTVNFGKALVAFACTDQVPNLGTPIVNYFTSGVAPNRILVLNYKNVQRYQAASNITSVQVQLYESGGKIEIHSTLNAGNGSQRTIGIQNASGTESYTSATLNNTTTMNANNEMIRFSLPSPCSHSVTIASTLTSLCDGQSASLTSTVTPAGTYTYQWFKDNVAIAGTTSANYTATVSGVYKLRVTNTSSCESFSTTENITKPFTPIIPTSSWYTCVSKTATVSPTGTYTYQWFKSNAQVSGANTNSFTPSTTGYYKVRVTSGSCSITSDSVNVLQNNLTVTGGTGYTCTDFQLLGSSLTQSPSTAPLYVWSGPNGFTSTSQYPTVNSLTPAKQGTYTVNVTVPSCPSFTGTSTLTVQPNVLTATGNTGYACANSTLSSSLLGSNSSTLSYLWTSPNNFTSTLQSPQLTNLTTASQGVYTVRAIFAGCNTLTATANLTVVPVSLSTNGDSRSSCGNANLYAFVPGFSSGISYSWTGPNNFTSTSSNILITNLSIAQRGIYTVVASIAGCATATLTSTAGLTVSPITLNAFGTNTYTCLNASLSSNLSTTPTNTPSYLWTGPNGFTNTNRNPTIPITNLNQQGIYTVQAVIPSCANVTATANVTVQSLTLTATNQTGYICDNVSLNPNIPCCSNPSPIFLWSGPNSFASTDKYPTISNLTPSQQGIYTVTATIVGCSTLIATSNVTVLPNTGNINYSGSQYLCGTRQLNFYPSGTVSPTAYLWTGPNNFSSTLSSPQIANQTLVNSGVYTLQVTFSSCGTATVTSNQTVQLNSVNISNSGGAFCPGQTVQLQANEYSTPGSSVTFTWAGPEGFTSTSATPNFIFSSTNAGVYTVIASFAGCSTASATTLITTQNFSVDAGIDRSLVCPSNTVTLLARISSSSIYIPPSPTTVSYQWTGPNGFSSTDRNPNLSSVVMANSGFYTLNAVFSNGCVGTSSSIIALNVRDNPEMYVNGGGAYCSGEPANISANFINYLGNTNVSYQWTGPDGFSSTQINPTISSVNSGGVYTISATFSNGCTGTYTNLVHIFSRKKPALLISNTTVCLGNTIYLRSSTDGSTNSSFSWQGPDSFRSNVENPIIVNATNAKLGIYTVSLTRTGCPETSSATATVSLSSGCGNTGGNICSISASNDGYLKCPGSLVSLNAYSNSSGASNLYYYWAGPNGFTANTQNVTINNATSTQIGYYTVTMSVTGGTCNGGVYTSQTLLSLKPATNTPTFSGNISRNIGCEDGNFYLSRNISDGTMKHYIITGPNGFVYYGKSSYYDYFYSNKPSQSGTYTINGIMNGECQSSTTDFSFSQSYNLTILSRLQAPTISNAQEGQTITFTGSGCSNQINWSVGTMTGFNYNYTTANPFIDIPSTTTTYWAICKSIDGCLSPSSNRILVSLSCTSMQSIQSGLWTNPSIWSCGAVPTSTNVTTISAGHIVTIPSSTSAFVRNLLNYGTLGYGQNASLRIGQ